ncbi:MAG: hypothetical protein HQK91_10575 [Nitrospirae bacterium]|nr:hypothetical protein [Nitrospirota bacterium]
MLKYVNQNKDKLLSMYRNKYILVQNGELINSFDKYETATKEGIKLFGFDADFLIQYITDIEPTNIIIAAN